MQVIYKNTSFHVYALKPLDVHCKWITVHGFLKAEGQVRIIFWSNQQHATDAGVTA